MSIILLEDSGRGSSDTPGYLRENPTEGAWANNDHNTQPATSTPSNNNNNASFREVSLGNRTTESSYGLGGIDSEAPNHNHHDDDDGDALNPFDWFRGRDSSKKDDHDDDDNDNDVFRNGSLDPNVALGKTKKLAGTASEAFEKLGPYRWWILAILGLLLLRAGSEAAAVGAFRGVRFAQAVSSKPCDRATGAAYRATTTALSHQNYSWLGNQWVPPSGVPFYTLGEMKRFFEAEDLLWIGDSTTRRACATVFAILNGTTSTPGVESITDLSVGDIDDTKIINLNMPAYGNKKWAQRPRSCDARKALAANSPPRFLQGADDDDDDDDDDDVDDSLLFEGDVGKDHNDDDDEGVTGPTTYFGDDDAYRDWDGNEGTNDANDANDDEEGSYEDEEEESDEYEEESDDAGVPAPTAAPTRRGSTPSPTAEIPALARMSGPLYAPQDYCRDLPVADPNAAHHASVVNHVRNPNTPAPTPAPTKKFDFVSVDCYVELRSLLERHGKAIRERYSAVVIGVGIHEFVNPSCAEAHDAKSSSTEASTPEERLEATLGAVAEHLLAATHDDNESESESTDEDPGRASSLPKVFWRTHGYSSDSEHHEKHSDAMVRLNQYARDWIADQQDAPPSDEESVHKKKHHHHRHHKKQLEPGIYPSDPSEPHQQIHGAHSLATQVQLVDWGGAVQPRSGPGLHIEGDGMHAHYGIEARTLLAQMLTQRLALDEKVRQAPPHACLEEEEEQRRR